MGHSQLNDARRKRKVLAKELVIVFARKLSIRKLSGDSCPVDPLSVTCCRANCFCGREWAVASDGRMED